MGAEFNYFFKVELTLARYANGAKATKTYSLVNKSPRDAASPEDSWPILRSIGEVSLNAGEVMPTVSLGSIELGDFPGSFGGCRSFSDLLQPGRWTPVEQPVTISVCQARNDRDDPSSWTVVATGVVSDWERAAGDDGESVTLSVRPVKLDEKVLTLEVNRSVVGMEAAPDSALGKIVPLLIGDEPLVIPTRVSADGSQLARYAWGTCLYNHLKNVAGTPTLYSKDADGYWAEIDQGAVINNTGTPTGSYTLNTYDGRAWSLNLNGGPLVTGVRLYAKANGAPARVSTASLDVFILRVGQIATVLEDPMVTGTVALYRYDALNNDTANTSFAINVSFDRPAFLAEGSAYYLGFRVRDYAVNDLSLNYNNTLRDELRQDDSSAATAGGSWSNTGSFAILHRLQEAQVYTSDQAAGFTPSGLSYSVLNLFQDDPDAGQENCSFDNLPIAIRPEQGLSAYSGGALKDSPVDLAELLGYRWNPGTNAWTATSSWDSSTLASSHYSPLYGGGSHRSRRVRGVFDRKATFTQVVSELARGSASRVGIFASGKAFMHPWGVTSQPARSIPFADVVALSWQQRDASTVVNRAVVNLGRNYLGSSRDFENAEDASSSYLHSTDFSGALSPALADLTRESLEMYGVRDLAQTDFAIYPYMTNGVEYLGGEGSILAEYYLAKFSKPAVYCSFVVPWHRYSGLRMFDVVRFSTPAFPAYFGSDPDPRQSWVVDTGSTVEEVDVNSSFEMVRAQTYRGLIEGISTILAMEHAPAIRLTVLVLQNHATDPT